MFDNFIRLEYRLELNSIVNKFLWLVFSLCTRVCGISTIDYALFNSLFLLAQILFEIKNADSKEKKCAKTASSDDVRRPIFVYKSAWSRVYVYQSRSGKNASRVYTKKHIPL